MTLIPYAWDMGIDVKDTNSPLANPKGNENKSPAETAVAAAFARLTKKKGKKAGAAADEVGELLDKIIGEEDDITDEGQLADDLMEEVLGEMPPGEGLDQAQAIADKLKARLDATRGRRDSLSQRVARAFEDL